jgi:hypothetical protein
MSLIDGFDLVDPGLVFIPRWRPESAADVPADAHTFGNLAAWPASPADAGRTVPPRGTFAY